MGLTALAAGTLAVHGLGCAGSRNREDYKIFSPGQIGTLQVKNRLIRSATFESAAANGEVTDTYVGLLRDLAAGGAGMIITGVMGIFKETEFERMIQIYDDRFVDGLTGSSSRISRCISANPASRSSASLKGVVPVSNSYSSTPSE